MRKTFGAVLALSLTVAACDSSPTMERAKSDADLMTAESLMSHIKVLASDEFGGRAPSSEGEKLTVDYLINAFTELGLEPANGDKYTQDVPLISMTAAPTASFKITDAAGKVTDLTYLKDMVVLTRRMQENIQYKDSEMVFVGYGINAPERGWNDYEGIDVKGKTVVIMVNDPGFATQDPALFNGNAMTYYGRWTYKYDEAAAQGAAGAIIIHDTAPAAYPWGVVENGWSGPQFYTVRADRGAGLTAMEGWVTNDVAAKMFADSGLDYEALKKAAETPGFKAVPMPLTAAVNIDTAISESSSQNVAGILRGSENPDEMFVYMAHWDHLGTDPNIEGDGIYNGAMDNATGTAALLELAKAFTQGSDKPKRSIMFLAVAAEEQGLLGSGHYGANPLHPLNKTVAGLNMDGLNTYGPTKDLMIIGHGNSELDDYMETIAKSYNRILVPDQSPEKGYFYRSDHFQLAKYGVPMLYAEAGINHLEKGEAYGREIAEYYTTHDYHQPSEEVKDDWVIEGAIADNRMYYDLGNTLSNNGAWPAWREGTEFKAIREAQLKE